MSSIYNVLQEKKNVQERAAEWQWECSEREKSLRKHVSLQQFLKHGPEEDARSGRQDIPQE